MPYRRARRDRKGSRGPSKGLVGIRRPSWRTGRGQEAVPKGPKESGYPAKETGAVRRPNRRVGSQEAHLEVREGSGDPPGWTRGVGRPFQRSRRGQEGLEGPT